MKNRHLVLIVDDTETNIDILVNALEDDYELSVALDGETALESARENSPDIILLDVMMPGMDGYEVCKWLKNSPETFNIPVIFITALSDEADEAKGLELGAVDYITKPFNPDLVRARLRNHLELKSYRDSLEEQVAAQVQELSQARAATIASMATLAEFRDPETGAHIYRTQLYVKLLAEKLAKKSPGIFKPSVIELLYQSAPLHDIGKVGVPDAILLKPSGLTREEFEEMKKHTLYGSRAIKKTETILGSNSFLYLAREIAEFHHERWDGSGYPHGLKGKEIPLCARLMSMADVYDALISKRPYKPPFTHEEAVKIITEGDGRTKPEHFDPDVMKIFKENGNEMEKIALKYRD